MPLVARLRRALGPLSALVVFFGAGLLFLSASRASLTLAHLGRIEKVEGAWRLFAVGLRMDTITLSIALFVPTPVLLLLPRRGSGLWKPVLATYFALVAALVVFMEVVTLPFMAQYDGRPNRIFIDYLAYPHEVAATIWADHKPTVVLALLLVGCTLRLAWRQARALLDDHRWWSSGWRLLVLPPFAALVFLGARSTLGHRGANISTAAFSEDHLANELALNSTYSLGYAVYTRRTEIDAHRLYGALPRRNVLARVRRQMLLPQGAFTRDDLPTLHRQTSARVRTRPYNLVILLEESLGAQYVGSLGGLDLTPNLDRLATEGLFLTNLYATGTRTVRGIEATVTGFLPMAGDSVVKLGLSQDGFFTLADLLRQRGYDTEFIYGGASAFDNMRGFFLNGGFARVTDGEAFTEPVLRGTWGVSDEDLVRRANATFVAHAGQPFFALLLSTSNHTPYEYPAGRVAPGAPGDNPEHGAIRYADWAIGEFFRLARREDYFNQTVFLVVADHDSRVYGADLVPIDHFHIPGVIIGPDVAPRRYDGVASQVDLAPTLLDLLGLDVEHPMVGRNLLAVPADVPGLAFMQYDLINAYRVGSQVVIHRPYDTPLQFTYDDGRLTPAPLDAELARDALAYIQLPGMMYHERSYRLPARGG